MSQIIFDCGISLDGFFAGDNRSPGNPMGGVSGKIHPIQSRQNKKHFKLFVLTPGDSVKIEYSITIPATDVGIGVYIKFGKNGYYLIGR